MLRGASNLDCVRTAVSDVTQAEPSAASPALPRALLYLCFFLSGLTALVYESLWFRDLHHVFGSTTHSVAAVLMGFMGGLGLGALVLGRLADRVGQPARLYGWMELGIGGWALVSPLFFGAVAQLYAGIQGWLDAGPTAAVGVKLALALPLLGLPTVLMGGTLPALVRGLTRSRSDVADELGRLYGINTLGAMTGAAFTGFVALELLGMRQTLHLAAALNLGVGLWILVRTRRGAPGAGAPPSASPASAGDAAPAFGGVAVPSPSLPRHAILYCTLGVAATGALTMLLELVWTRNLAALTGATSYAFSLVLTVLLAGLGLGGGLFGLVARRRRPGPGLYGLLLLGLAACVALTLPGLAALPRLVLYVAQVPGLGFGSFLLLQLGVYAALLLPPTLLMGAALPLAMGVALQGPRSLGAGVGLLYLANTLAGVLGSLLGGFWLLQVLGSQGCLRLGVVTLVGLGAWGVLRYERGAGRRGLALGLAGLALALGLGSPDWSGRLFNASAAYQLGGVRFDDRLGLERFLLNAPSRLAFLREGRDATVAVRQFPWATSLIINGKPDASTSRDMSTQVFIGLLPMMVHPAPRDALVVGYGSGVTGHAVASFAELQRLEVVELEAAVVEAGRYFRSVNGDLGADPRVELVVDDARSRLLASDRSYDVIVSEPSHLQLAGTPSLFTREFYELAQRRLRPGGIFVQWLHLYRLQPRSLAVVLRTLAESFPELQVWALDEHNVGILCSRQPIPWDLERLRQRLQSNPYLAESMALWWKAETPQEVFGHFLMDRRQVELSLRGFPELIHSDDRPILEFLVLEDPFGPQRELVEEMWRSRLALGWTVPQAGVAFLDEPLVLAAAARGFGDLPPLARRLTRAAWESAQRARAAGRPAAGEPLARLALAEDRFARGDLDGTLGLLAGEPGGWSSDAGLRAQAALLRGRVLSAQGQVAAADEAFQGAGPRAVLRREIEQVQALLRGGRRRAAFERLLAVLESLQRGALKPHPLLPVEGLYDTLFELAKTERELPRLSVALADERLDPWGEIPRRQTQARCLLAQGRAPEALQALERLAAFDLLDPDLLWLEAETLYRVGRVEEAQRRVERLLELDPKRFSSPLLLGADGQPAAPLQGTHSL